MSERYTAGCRSCYARSQAAVLSAEDQITLENTEERHMVLRNQSKDSSVGSGEEGLKLLRLRIGYSNMTFGSVTILNLE